MTWLKGSGVSLNESLNIYDKLYFLSVYIMPYEIWKVKMDKI